MNNSARTKMITKSLVAVAEQFSFVPRRDVNLFREYGTQIKRTDVVWCIPRSRNRPQRPVLFFEIDSDPDRSMYNRVKIAADVLALDAIPVFIVAARHGPAISHEETISKTLLKGFHFPPIWVQDLDLLPATLDTSHALKAALVNWFEDFIKLCVRPPRLGGVMEVSKAYQPLLANGNLALASAHLAAHAEMLWHLVSKGYVKEKESAAVLSIARARLLQCSGQHEEAKYCLADLNLKFDCRSELSANSASILKVVSTLLVPTGFGENGSVEILTSAKDELVEPYHKAQMWWRIGLAHLIRNEPTKAERIIADYGAAMEMSPTPSANVELMKTLLELNRDRGEPIKHAIKYARKALKLLEISTYGTFHGAIAGVYLMLLAIEHEKKKNLPILRNEIAQLSRMVGVSINADGIREIIAGVEKVKPNWKTSLGSAESATLVRSGNVCDLAGRENIEKLRRIWWEVRGNAS